MEGPLHGLLLEVGRGHAHHLEVVLKGDALGGDAAGVVVHHLVCAVLHHGVGDLNLHVGDHLLHQGVLKVALGLGLPALLELLAQVLLQVRQGLELGHVLGELVVHHGGLLLLDLMQLHVEDHALTGQLCVVVLGEGDVDVALVAGLHADELLLKAGDEGPGAQLQAVALGLAALEGHAVVEALEVQHDGVAVLGGAVGGDQAGGALNKGLELAVNILVGHGSLGLGRGEALVVAQLDLRADRHDGLEAEAVLAGVQNLHVGIGHGIQLLLLDCLGIGLGVNIVDGIFIENTGAVHSLDDLAGRMALAETGDGDAAALLLVDLIDSGLKLLAADLDDELDSALFLLLYALDIHVVTSSCQRLQRVKNNL